jgi:hypothetical protein
MHRHTHTHTHTRTRTRTHARMHACTRTRTCSSPCAHTTVHTPCTQLLDMLEEARATQTLAFTLTDKQRGRLIRIRKVGAQGGLTSIEVAVFAEYA